MNLLNGTINLLECLLILVFAYSFREDKEKHFYIASAVYLSASFAWICFLNIHYTYEGYMIAGDIVLLFAYFSVISNYSWQKKLALSILPNVSVYVINTLTTIIFSLLLFHRIDYAALMNHYQVFSLIFTKVMFAVALYFLSQYINHKLQFLSDSDCLYSFVLLLITIMIFISLSTVLYEDRIDQLQIVLSIFCVLIFTIIVFFHTIVMNEKERQSIKDQYQIELLQNKLTDSTKLLESQEQLHKIRHDLKELLSLYDGNGITSQSDVKNIHDRYKNELDAIALPITTPDAVINQVLNLKREEAKSKEIEFTCKLNIVNPVSMDRIDLQLLLCNLLDNAIQHIGIKKQIFVEMETADGYFQIRISNSIDHNVLNNNHSFKSTAKNSAHGYGVDTVKELLKKYNGELFYDEDSHNLTCLALIPQHNQ